MTGHHADLSDADANNHMLCMYIEEYQQAWRDWQDATTDKDRACHWNLLGDIQENMWPLIEEVLRPLARSQLHTWVARDLMTHTTPSDGSLSSLDSLVMSLYALLQSELPKLKIDPTNNVPAFIRRVVQNRLSDQGRKLIRYHQRTISADERARGTPDAGAWLDSLRAPNSEHTAEQFIARLYYTDVFRHVHAYWEQTLNTEDNQIMQRWKEDPPTPFRAIAEQLGPGWTEGAVRQRHHRILQRTRAYLEEQGLSDP